MTTTWELPLEAMMAAHRKRIDDETLVPSIVETWHEGKNMPSWTTWIGPTGPDIELRDAALHAVKIMAVATEADYVVFSFDSHMAKEPINPKTGQPWVHGEMQNLCDSEGYCDTGQIRDNLVVSIVRRSDAKLYFHSIPYHFHKGELILYPDENIMTEWDDNAPAAAQMGGIIPDAMRAAVRLPTLRAMMSEEFNLTPDQFNLDEDDTRLHTILAGVTMLAKSAVALGAPDMFMCVVPAENDHQEKIIKRSAARSGLTPKRVSTV